MDAQCTRAPGTGAGARGTPQPQGKGKGKDAKGKGKGKGKDAQAKGKGKGQPACNPPTGAFAGLCNRCGRWGHKAQTCRASLQAVEEAPVPVPAVQLMEEVFEVACDMRAPYQLALVDSGAFACVAPPWWCSWLPIQAMHTSLRRSPRMASHCNSWGNAKSLVVHGLEACSL